MLCGRENTTTLNYSWTPQGGANHLTTFSSSSGITVTFDYDTAGRIVRRYTARGYSDYIYEGSTNWLVREIWHSAVSGNTFDLVRYQYTSGRPSRAEIAYVSGDWSAVWSYDQRYLQANWHGDIVRRVWLNGDGGTEMAYDPWGNGVRGLHYYEWNGAWGYMAFGALQLYYVHGRWYNPDTGLWLSPDGNGSYKYNAHQNPLSYAYSGSAGGLSSPARQGQTGRYIRTRYGAIIDMDHWTVQHAFDVIQAVKAGGAVPFNLSLGTNPITRQSVGNIDLEYRLTRPAADVYGVALGIWQDFEMKFETAQPVFPIGLSYPCHSEGFCSSRFAIEDLPTDYLAFWAAATADKRGIAITDNLLDEVVDALGGATERTNRVPPHCPGNEPDCPSQNRKFTPMLEETEILRQYWKSGDRTGFYPVTRHIERDWPDKLRMIDGQRLEPIDDGWEVTRCQVNAWFAGGGCNAGKQVRR